MNTAIYLFLNIYTTHVTLPDHNTLPYPGQRDDLLTPSPPPPPLKRHIKLKFLPTPPNAPSLQASLNLPDDHVLGG